METQRHPISITGDAKQVLIRRTYDLESAVRLVNDHIKFIESETIQTNHLQDNILKKNLNLALKKLEELRLSRCN